MRITLPLILIILGLVPSHVVAHDGDAALEIVLAMTAAVNAGDFEALDGLVSPNVVRHSAATPDVTVENLDQFKDFLQQDSSGLETRIDINFTFATDEMVAVHASYVAAQPGPNGKTAELPFITLFRIEDAKVAEIWAEWDNLNLMTQLGLYPPPAEGEPTADQN